MIKQILALNLFLITYSLPQNLAQSYSFDFGLEDAKIDSSLSDDVRAQFDDDDGSLPLKSIAVDLNNDGVAEKLIPNEFMCGNGGCPWVVYNTRLKTFIGHIDAKELYILTKHKNGYCIIETYWRGAAGEGGVSFYEYSNGKYASVKTVPLKDEQINRYFEQKKSLKK